MRILLDLQTLPARIANFLASRSTPATFTLCLIAAVVLVAAYEVPR